MDERLKRRITLFYVAGFFNVALGLYVLFKGREFLDPGTANILILFFAVFAAVDFYMPGAMRRKYAQEVARLRAQQQQQDAGSGR